MFVLFFLLEYDDVLFDILECFIFELADIVFAALPGGHFTIRLSEVEDSNTGKQGNLLLADTQKNIPRISVRVSYL